jgi:predicted alternative tryptophan synthase beta-subunit
MNKRSLAYKQTERKKKKHDHLIRCKKGGGAFDKIQYPFMIKVLERLEKLVTYLNIIKIMFIKLTANTN